MASDVSDPDPLLIAGGYSDEIRFFDAHSAAHKHTLFLGEECGHVNRLAVSPDGEHLLVTGNPHVRFYDLTEACAGRPPPNAPLCRFEGHKSNVGDAGFEHHGKWVYTGSEDGTMRIWDSRAQKCQLKYENQGQFERIAIHSVDLHPNQVDLLAGDHRGQLLVWDLRQPDRIRQTLVPDGVPIRSVCVEADARACVRVVCANHEGTFYVWQLEDDNFQPMNKIEAHGAYILRCMFSPEAKRLATTSADSTTNLWELNHLATTSGEAASTSLGFALSSTLRGHSKWVWDCDFSRDGKYLVTASSDQTCRLWDVSSGQQRLQFDGFKKGVTSVALMDSFSTFK